MSTADGGETWTELSKAPTEVPSIEFMSPSYGWLSTRDGLFSTTDGGETFQQINETDLPDDANARVQFIDADHGWAVVGEKLDFSLWGTSDGGHTWSKLEMPCQALRLGASLVDARTGWLACGGQPATAMSPKELYRTRDFGGHWEPVSCACLGSNTHGVPDTMPASGHLRDVFFLDETHGW
jgi:photosystem II stability/assembly factor-like uncharacterized protein